MNRRDAIKALMVGLPATATLSEARLTPDDVIVIETDDCLSCDQAARIRELIERVWPGRKVIVLGDGLHMKIARSTS